MSGSSGKQSEMLRVQGLSIRLGGCPVLRDVNLTLSEAETLVVLGSSGCGKSTLLKCLAGVLRPDAGTVQVSGSGVGPVSLYLDQEPLLFEHLNVFENAAFALRMRRVAEVEVRREVGELLEMTGLHSEVRKSVGQLSGGQKQRLAFVRAIVARPHLLLMDEPFAALDAQTRSRMQSIFRSVAARFRMTTIFVTHDVRESLSVGTAFGRLVDGSFLGYADRQAFVEDPATGVRGELEFWDGIRDGG